MSGIFTLQHEVAGNTFGASPVGSVRTYAPGYRPWIAFQGFGADPATTTIDLNPLGLKTAALVAVGALALGVLVAYPLMGHYVGKRLGSRWGWFWGLGGPIGLAAMQGYRQLRGRVSSPMMPNRRRGRRRARRMRSNSTYGPGDKVFVRYPYAGRTWKIAAAIIRQLPDGRYRGMMVVYPGGLDPDLPVMQQTRPQFWESQIIGRCPDWF